MYTPSRHFDTFFIAGFQFHDGACVVRDIQVGNTLRLQLEEGNPHDPNAVGIYYAETLLGYIPRDSNELIANLLRFGHAHVFECRVLQVDTTADPWKQVRVGLYIQDALKA